MDFLKSLFLIIGTAIVNEIVKHSFNSVKAKHKPKRKKKTTRKPVSKSGSRKKR